MVRYYEGKMPYYFNTATETVFYQVITYSCYCNIPGCREQPLLPFLSKKFLQILISYLNLHDPHPIVPEIVIGTEYVGNSFWSVSVIPEK